MYIFSYTFTGQYAEWPKCQWINNKILSSFSGWPIWSCIETLIGVKSRCSNKTTGIFLYCSCVGPMARLMLKLLHATWSFRSEGLWKGPTTNKQVAHHWLDHLPKALKKTASHVQWPYLNQWDFSPNLKFSPDTTSYDENPNQSMFSILLTLTRNKQQ